MKLEVGQKIGIYEALANCFPNVVIVGKCYCAHSEGSDGASLFVKGQKVGFYMYAEEVRLVASLRVKALK